jgi:hypothetical protein
LSELFEYVRIGQNQDGYALVEVCMIDQSKAVTIFLETIKDLDKSNTVKVAFPQNRIETTNSNKDRIATVTVKGDEALEPTEKFIAEKNKALKEGLQ